MGVRPDVSRLVGQRAFRKAKFGRGAGVASAPLLPPSEMKHSAAMLTEMALQSLPTGLRLDSSGTIRVGRSRVTFDLVVEQFEGGASAEDIVARFTTLDLPSVYSAIAWYLHHRGEAAEYLTERGAKSAANREEVERRWPAHGLRERLLARWEARKRDAATP